MFKKPTPRIAKIWLSFVACLVIAGLSYAMIAAGSGAIEAVCFTIALIAVGVTMLIGLVLFVCMTMDCFDILLEERERKELERNQRDLFQRMYEEAEARKKVVDRH